MCTKCAKVREGQKEKQIDIESIDHVIKEKKMNMNMNNTLTMRTLRKLHKNRNECY